MSDYDFVVIGGGSAGLTAVDFAAKLGAKVALVERHRLGGDCTWSGCVPSKALIHVAKTMHGARLAAQFAERSQSERADWTKVRAYVERAIASVYEHETPARLRERGVEVIEGAASFAAHDRVVVAGRTIQSKRTLICTGAKPFVPPVNGLRDAGFVTYEQVFALDRLPERLVVMGGGPIGLEMAQAFRRLGAEVCVVSDAFLPREEPSARAVIERQLEREGVVLLRATIEAVHRVRDTLHIETSEHTLEGDVLLVATGRRPNIESLALDAAAITTNNGAIVVGADLQTSAKGVYAAGDVLGGPQFTHLAGWQGFRAARNALLPGTDATKSSVLPRITFVDPEVASVGLTEAEARESFGDALAVHRLELAQCDRAVCEDATEGFVQLLTGPEQTVIGATIVAPRAGEMLTELCVAMQHGLTLGQLASVIHGYPSWSTAVQQVAVRASVDSFLAGRTAKVAIQLGRWLR